VAEVARRQRATRVAAPDPGAWLDVTQAELLSDRRAQLARLYTRYCVT
jgi:hypothetical protein